MATVLCFWCPGVWARPSEHFFAGLSGSLVCGLPAGERVWAAVSGLSFSRLSADSHCPRGPLPFRGSPRPPPPPWPRRGAQPFGAKAQHPQYHLCCIQWVKTSHETRVPGWGTGLRFLRREVAKFRCRSVCPQGQSITGPALPALIPSLRVIRTVYTLGQLL